MKNEEEPMEYKETLTTERLILRKPTTDDLEAFQSWCGNPENTRYMSFGPNTEKQTLNWLLQSNPCKDFAVVLKKTNAVIGSCGIYPNDANETGELGWILHMNHWKHGYGTELGAELIRYGFEDLRLRRITAPCAAVNYGSYRVMERNGMRREALHIKAFWARKDKEWIDRVEYAILAEEYYKKQQFGNFWVKIDKLIADSEVFIDHPKGSKHPRFDFVYPLDYGYLKETTSPDGGGIDVWFGSDERKVCDAVICTVDVLKKDSEIKLLIGCTENEKLIALQTHNDSEYMSGLMIRRIEN